MRRPCQRRCRQRRQESPFSTENDRLAACLLAGYSQQLRCRGGPETVLSRDPQAVQLLWMALRSCHDATQLLSGMPPQVFDEGCSWALANFTRPTWASCRLHETRSATHTFGSCRNLGQTLLRSCRVNLMTARIFITEGALILTLTFYHKAVQRGGIPRKGCASSPH